MIGLPLTHGFMAIPDCDATKLAAGRLPDEGMEKLIEVDGNHYWMQRTILTGNEMDRLGHSRRWVWTIRKTNWRLENGMAVLR